MNENQLKQLKDIFNDGTCPACGLLFIRTVDRYLCENKNCINCPNYVGYDFFKAITTGQEPEGK